jgi:NADPH-dependent 2,4-dienoyl-CoA reductase/sulfur reductase-like enzyme
MREIKYLLMGAGLASLNAAKKIRKNDTTGSVVMIGDDTLPPYHLPSLSKEYLRGIQPEAELVYSTKEALAAQAVECRLAT